MVIYNGFADIAYTEFNLMIEVKEQYLFYFIILSLYLIIFKLYGTSNVLSKPKHNVIN